MLGEQPVIQQAPIAAAGWARVARAAADRRRVLSASAEVHYGDQSLRQTAVGRVEYECAVALRDAVAGQAGEGEILEALLAGDPTLDHHEALELLEAATATPVVVRELVADTLAWLWEHPGREGER